MWKIQSEQFKTEIIEQNKAVRASGVPNIEHCRFLTQSSWDLHKMESLLTDYHDKEVVELLRFGWPINSIDTKIDTSIPKNQEGICQNLGKVLDYLESELQNKSVVGPFKENPFGRETRISPLGTRPKKDAPEEIRVILNLSHPFEEGSVNSSIPKDSY